MHTKKAWLADAVACSKSCLGLSQDDRLANILSIAEIFTWHVPDKYCILYASPSFTEFISALRIPGLRPWLVKETG